MLPKSGAAITGAISVMTSKLSHCSFWFSRSNSRSMCRPRRTSSCPSDWMHPNHGQRWFTSPSSHTSSTLSRTERRALERRQRNKERRQATGTNSSIKANTNPKSASYPSQPQGRFQLPVLTVQIRQRLQEAMYPRVFGSGQQFHKDHLSALIYRLPLALALGYLLTDSDADLSPYTIQPSLGPSMLPTIQFIGDVWLVETGAWSRRLGIPLQYQHGDVVLWKDPTTGRVSCKRIIGVQGDSIQRYGQYAKTYHHHQDKDGKYGIVWPKHSNSDSNNTNNNKNDTSWDPTPQNTQIDRPYTVPEGHVWLEGDCPPFSLDSRHYGPIPTSWIRGRLLLRLWPWTDDLYFENIPSRQSKWMRNNSRPVPFSDKEQYLGKRFNFYRISSQQETKS